MAEIHNYCLAFKVDKKNPMPVEISKVDSFFEFRDVCNLSIIDKFTEKYTNDELMRAIRKSNILTEEYLNGELIVMDTASKWKKSPILKDTFLDYNIIDFMLTNKDNKDIMNKLYTLTYNYLKNSDEENIIACKKLFLEENDLKKFLQGFASLPYIVRREIRVLGYELHKKEQKIKELKKAS